MSATTSAGDNGNGNDDDRTVLIPGAASIPAAPPMGSNILAPGTKLGEFEITGLIGEGGFGIVSLAQDHSLQRKVALKEYMPSALAARTGQMTVSVKSDRYVDTFAAGLKSFINEARLLAQFDHPSLVKVYRFWEANGTAYMVMPYYEGVTLKEALHQLGSPPSERWLKDLLRPLFDAIAQLHREQCFHRDIAPDNILILKNGRPLLLDFGAARRVIGDMTQALTVILKPGYAPVEQYAEMPDLKQGPWTDIYALASVVHFAITGKAPIPSVARMMSDSLRPLTEQAAGRYSEQFLKGIDKSLAVKPNDRPQSIGELFALWGIEDRRQHPRGGTTSADAQREAQTKNDISLSSNKHSATRRYAALAAVLIATIGTGAFFTFQKNKSGSPATSATESTTSTIAPASTTTTTAEKPVSATITDAPKSTTAHNLNQPFDPGKMLDDIFEGRHRAHAVTASVEQAQVHIGHDNLRFSISSSKPGYLYILVIGTNRTDFNLLFPNAVDKDNRINPGQTIKLPGAKWPMKAQGPTGTDQFIAIVSDMPRDFSDLKPIADDVFQKFPLDVGAALYSSHSDASPLFAGKVICESKGNCSNAYGAAIFSIEEIAAPVETRKTGATNHADKTQAIAAITKSSPTLEVHSNRCSNTLQKASLGEPLTVEEQAIIQKDCK